ncbi:unnamed protein product [Lota lota]
MRSMGLHSLLPQWHSSHFARNPEPFSSAEAAHRTSAHRVETTQLNPGYNLPWGFREPGPAVWCQTVATLSSAAPCGHMWSGPNGTQLDSHLLLQTPGPASPPLASPREKKKKKKKKKMSQSFGVTEAVLLNTPRLNRKRRETITDLA